MNGVSHRLLCGNRRPGEARVARVVVLALALALPIAAHGGGWPVPAGGESVSGNPEVLFTFDDGPHLKHSAAVLDELERRQVKAIFFWVGWRLARGDTDAHRELVRRAVRDGHVVANHTVNHPNLCLIDELQAADEIDASGRTLEEIVGLPIFLFRAPYGAHCERLLRLLDERSLEHVYWDIDPQEWSHHNAKRTAGAVIRKLQRLEGRAIILMHDTHRVTVKALPIIFDWIAQENRRREKSGKRNPIRILSTADFLTERLDIDVLRWVAETASGSATRLQTALGRLIP